MVILGSWHKSKCIYDQLGMFMIEAEGESTIVCLQGWLILRPINTNRFTISKTRKYWLSGSKYTNTVLKKEGEWTISWI